MEKGHFLALRRTPTTTDAGADGVSRAGHPESPAQRLCARHSTALGENWLHRSQRISFFPSSVTLQPERLLPTTCISSCYRGPAPEGSWFGSISDPGWSRNPSASSPRAVTNGLLDTPCDAKVQTPQAAKRLHLHPHATLGFSS